MEISKIPWCMVRVVCSDFYSGSWLVSTLKAWGRGLLVVLGVSGGGWCQWLVLGRCGDWVRAVPVGSKVDLVPILGTL